MGDKEFKQLELFPKEVEKNVMRVKSNIKISAKFKRSILYDVVRKLGIK